MKMKAIVSGCLISAVVFFVGYEYNRAWGKSEADKPVPNIGVVSIQKIFRNCKRNAKYRQEAVAEQDRIIAELEKLSKDIEAERAGLKTLKIGSHDYSALMKETLEKQAKLQARQEFYKQQIELKDQQWTEGLYKDILQETSELAKQKGLDLVLEKDEIELPMPSVNELMMTIRTHKLLYSGGCLDMTDEVMARLDAKESEK